jgi:hypothetical protein
MISQLLICEIIHRERMRLFWDIGLKKRAQKRQQRLINKNDF